MVSSSVQSKNGRDLVTLQRDGQESGVSNVKLTIYDLLGREVATLVNERKPAGTYTVRFDASGLASGVYLYRITAGSFVQSKKMVLLH